jgi:hypothetical protein
MDLLLKLVEDVCSTGSFMNVLFYLLDPVLKVHVAHVLLYDLLDEFTILPSVDLRNVR